MTATRKTVDESTEDEFHGNRSYDPDFAVPCTAAYEFVTPDLAKQWLDAGNRKNREVRDAPVQRLGGVLNRYEWMWDSTDAIGLADEDEAVVNGQHRLSAIRDNGKGVWCLVVRGARKDVIRIIDQGTARTLAQTLKIQGGYPEPTNTAQAVRWLYIMGLGLERQLPGALEPTVPQQLALLMEHPNLVNSLEAAGEVKAKLNTLSKGVWTAYHYAFASVDPDLAEDFYNKLATGIGTSAIDPAYVLREKFLSNAQKSLAHLKLRPYEAAHFLVLAWEATRQGEQLSAKSLKFIKAGQNATKVASISDIGWLGTLPEPEVSEPDPEGEED